MITIFSGQTANTTSSEFIYSGGTRLLQLFGGFGSGTVTLSVSVDGSNWQDIENGAFTAAAAKLITLPDGCKIRAVLSGSSGANLTVLIS